jgi:hypothetical protein
MTLLRLTLTWLLVMTCPGWLPAHAQAPRPATGDVAPQARWGKLSASIPDVAVLDHRGHTRKFYTDLVKGKTVAITSSSRAVPHPG